MRTFRKWLWVALLICWMPVQAETTKADITILSTMVANYLGGGEWGFAALIETPDQSILFDTGFKAQTVLTHFHTDHTGGLLTLREAYKKKNPKALSKVYVANGFFDQRYDANHQPAYSLPNPDFTRSFKTPEEFKKAAEALGIRFIIVDSPTKLAPGVVLTGPITRTHPERNVSPGLFLKAGDETVSWTAGKLEQFGYKKFVGAHCTGARATYQIRDHLDLPDSAVSIGAVGTRIDADLVIHPASIE